MLDHLIQGHTYTKQELAAFGFPDIEAWRRCVYPRPPHLHSWCVLFVTLKGSHDYINKIQGHQLTMQGKDRDLKVNRWLVGSLTAGHRVGLLLRDTEGLPFMYRGEVTLASGSPQPAYFVWNIP